MNFLKSFNYITLCLLLSHTIVCTGQGEIFIQLEDDLTSKYYRYYPGDKIQFKTKEFPDDWRKAKIQSIMPQDSIIILKEGGYIKVDDIIRVRQSKGKWGKIIGGAIIPFGAGIIVYGTLGNLSDGGEKKISGAPALIGGLIATVGWLITKTGRRKKYTIGKHTRLRIYDIRWPDPVKARNRV